MVFDHSGSVVSVDQIEHEQIFPQAGWVEHDAAEIWNNTREVDRRRAGQGRPHHERHRRGRHHQPARDRGGLGQDHRRAGLQRDRLAGHPHPEDLRRAGRAGGGQDRYKAKVGLPLATYFSGPKVRWILDNVDGAREKAEAGDLLFGNTDAWVLWNLTGGVDGGVHVTDSTNAQPHAC